MNEVVVDLRKIVGKGYRDVWNSRKRWLVLKGGRGSKKSVTMSLRFIYNLQQQPYANLLVIRKHANTNKDSTFALLKWATIQLGSSDRWKFIENPLEATYLPTGQKILFRGLDDPLKLTSITVTVGTICWHWWEEAFEIETKGDFDTVEETLRGLLPEGLWPETVLSYNPWIYDHWTNETYWLCECPDNVSRFTTTHKCNEFVSQEYHDALDALAITEPRRHRVVALGEYGIPGGNFFKEFREDLHVIPYMDPPKDSVIYFSMDYGLDMLAAIWVFVDFDGDATVFKSINKPGLTIPMAVKEIIEMNDGMKVHRWYAPPDIWKTNAETGRQMKDVFFDHGNGIPLTMSKNARAAGCNAMYEWLHPVERINPITGVKTLRPRLRITDNNRTVISNLAQIAESETHPNEYANEPHILTHSCLTGDTLVDTVYGSIPITQLVGKEGYVYCYDEVTHQKDIKQFNNVVMTNDSAEIIEIEVENGKTIRCTLDHPILTQRGWVQAGELNIDDDIVSVTY